MFSRGAAEAEQEAGREDKLRQVFNSIDRDNNGRIDASEFELALDELGLPACYNYTRELLEQYDKDGDGEITYEEFRRYVYTKEARIRRVFDEMDGDKNGQLDAQEVRRAATGKAPRMALGLAVNEKEVGRMIGLLDTDGDSKINYQEFRRFAILLPGAQVNRRKLVAAWVDSADWVDCMEYRLNHIPPTQPLERLLAGGVAGAVSRTVVAPLERLRTLMMTEANARSLMPVLRRMWGEGGVKGLFRGNLATVVKVFPASAIQFSTYDSVKDVMLLSQGQGRGGGMASDLSNAQKFTAGLISGATACTFTYPLEAMRTQVQVSQGAGVGYLALLRGTVANGGLRGLYRGYNVALVRDCIGYGLGFAGYEALCSLYKDHVNHGRPTSPGERGVLGGLAAMLVMTATMPQENVMRRLQVQGRPGFPQQYRGALDCVSQMLHREGVASFWRGSLSSYLKVVPSIAATRLLYESLVKVGGIGGVRRYRLASEQGG
ncbi:hypothetical protein N2152v2_008144 [Parachlorella kessleri]